MAKTLNLFEAIQNWKHKCRSQYLYTFATNKYGAMSDDSEEIQTSKIQKNQKMSPDSQL